MTDAIRVLQPEFKVVLHKLVKRSTVDGTLPTAQRYADSGPKIDITNWFSDQSAISTAKSVREAAGGFTLTFSDKPHGSGASLETIYGLVEPMDGIEIRASHGHGRRSGQPPIIMRGFVSRVARSQAVDSSGKPFRSVTITGHDYGKIWQMLRIEWRALQILGRDTLSTFPLFWLYGINVTTNMAAAEMVRQFVSNIINQHLSRMLPTDWEMPKEIKVDAQVTEGLTSLLGPQGAEGSIYDILATFTDVNAGFNELYIEDRDDGAYAVFRPNPALAIDGTPIQPAGVGGTPALTAIPSTDIVSLDLSRSDQNVANFFWVEGARFEMTTEIVRRDGAITGADRQTVLMESYPNNLPTIYGIRSLIVSSNMGASDTFSTGQDAAGQQRRARESEDWLTSRRRILGEANRDNAMLESGAATITGNETIRAGSYVVIGEGALAASYYVASVQQQIIPFKGWFTVLNLERGMGFARRIQVAGQTPPYLIELGAGRSNAPQARPGPTNVSQAEGPGPSINPPASTATER